MKGVETKKTVQVTTKYRTFLYVCNKLMTNDGVEDAAFRMFPTEHFTDDRGRQYYKIQTL